MHKCLFLTTLAVVCCLSAGAQKETTQPKLSPLTQQYLLQTASMAEYKPVKGYVYKQDAAGHLFISALIKVKAGFDDRQLQQMGAYTGTRAGDIWTVQVPVQKVSAFTKLGGVDYIQLDEPVYPVLDSVRKVTRTDSVHAGINLPAAFTGKNVVMGILDVGFDYSHPLFFDTLGNTFRVKKVWEQKTTGGTPPSGFVYGNELTASTAMWATGTDIVSQSHGTHVAGIAAGSGFGSSADNHRFRGIAFGTDVVLVGITPPQSQWMNTGMTDLIDGMNYVYQYANAVGKPAVVNLSWGCTIGSHDGLSLFSQACDNLTGPGKLFVCSAGNTGARSIHVQKTFTATDTLVSTFVNFDGNLSERRTWVDIWGDSSKTFCVKASLYSNGAPGNNTGFICLDNTTRNAFLVGAAGDTCFFTITTSDNDFNGKPRILLNIFKRAPDALFLTVRGNSGKINMWNGYVENSTGYYGSFSNNGQAWATTGNSQLSISDFSSTKSAIAVGAFATRTDGIIASFSSKGPTADGRIKPDIAAPGVGVASGVNSYDVSFLPGGSNSSTVVNSFQQGGRTYSYALLSGTSMSSPVVSGITALLLEAVPTLTPQKVKDALAQTAITDAFTGTIPPAGTNVWGHGKANAYAAIRYVLHDLSVNNPIGQNMKWSVYPNPNRGSYTLECTTDKSETATVELADLTGKVLIREEWKLTAGRNLHFLNAGPVAKGLYMTRIITSRGQSAVKTLID